MCFVNVFSQSFACLLLKSVFQGGVILNFGEVCDGQVYVSPDWATGCADIWINITSDVSVRMFSDEVNI